MASKGLRVTSLSRYNEIDAGDELRIPLKSFLAILHVMPREYVFFSYNTSKFILSIIIINRLF